MTDDHAVAEVGSDIAMPLARPVSVATFSDNLESRWRIPAARVHGAAMHGCPGGRRPARFPNPENFWPSGLRLVYRIFLVARP